jgi:hypothetical protein
MTGLALAGKAIGVRLTLLPAFEFYKAGVMVHNLRPVLVPWSMISAATATQVDGGLRPALLLVNGQVLPLRLAAKISSAEESDTIKIIDDARSGTASPVIKHPRRPPLTCQARS